MDLRLLTNNNRVDLAGEGLDYAIRFGDGAWHGTDAWKLFDAPLSPLCASVVARRMRHPGDLALETLLRSYRADEWTQWFATAKVPCPAVRGFIFDSSLTMAEAAVQGAGVALLPVRMFGHELRQERLMQPFNIEVALGSYWLTRLKSRLESPAMDSFKSWLLSQSEATNDASWGTPVLSLGARPFTKSQSRRTRAANLQVAAHCRATADCVDLNGAED